tara:strand:+ start:4484 stop:5227 length:744 start_codon:yes stop_codon:yes gene_type:complete
MNTLFVGHNLLKFSFLSSTNDCCWELLSDKSLPDGTVVWSPLQTQGKGQRGKSWLSEEGKSLSFSIVFKPKVNVSEQYFLNKAISLGVCEGVAFLGVKSKIKWPNDIYVGNKKLAGILIENSLRGRLLQDVIVGVGVNINQEEFPKYLPNPVSLKQVLQQTFDIEVVLKEFCYYIEKRYMQFMAGHFEKIDADYHNVLYRHQQMQTFQVGNERFEAQIVAVDKAGKIKLLHQGHTAVYAMGEVEFVS